MRRTLHSKGYQYLIKGQQAKEILEEVCQSSTPSELKRVKQAQQNRVKRPPQSSNY